MCHDWFEQQASHVTCQEMGYESAVRDNWRKSWQNWGTQLDYEFKLHNIDCDSRVNSTDCSYEVTCFESTDVLLKCRGTRFPKLLNHIVRSAAKTFKQLEALSQ